MSDANEHVHEMEEKLEELQSEIDQAEADAKQVLPNPDEETFQGGRPEHKENPVPPIG